MSLLLSPDITRHATTVDARRGLELILRDGTPAVLRPLGDGEAGPLEAVFAGMSAASRASRYLVGLPRLPASFRRALTAVDGHRHVAWVAEIGSRPAGIARFIRLAEDDGSAEFAFEVVDEHHGRGLAGVLLHVVAAVAVAHGVTTLRASLAPDNVASRRLVTRYGARVHLVDGLLEAEGTLTLPAPAPVDDALVLEVHAEHRGRR